MDGILVFDLSQEFKMSLNNIFIFMKNYVDEQYLDGFVKKINKGFSYIQDHPFIYPIFLEEKNRQCRKIIIDKYIIVYIVVEERRVSVIHICHQK